LGNKEPWLTFATCTVLEVNQRRETCYTDVTMPSTQDQSLVLSGRANLAWSTTVAVATDGVGHDHRERLSSRDTWM